MTDSHSGKIAVAAMSILGSGNHLGTMATIWRRWWNDGDVA